LPFVGFKIPSLSALHYYKLSFSWAAKTYGNQSAKIADMVHLK